MTQLCSGILLSFEIASPDKQYREAEKDLKIMDNFMICEDHPWIWPTGEPDFPGTNGPDFYPERLLVTMDVLSGLRAHNGGAWGRAKAMPEMSE